MALRDVERQVQALRSELARVRGGEESLERFSPYLHDPAGFFADILGLDSATLRSSGRAYQSDILEDLDRHPRVAVRSGHGVGKSVICAAASLWWLLTRFQSRVVIVAPEFSRQVRAVLFGEIRKCVRRSTVPLPIDVLTGQVRVKGYGEEWAVIGLPATEPDRIEGFHSDGGVLLILDEVKGVPNAVYDALQGALTGHAENRLLLTSTPGPPSGKFYEVFAKSRDDWKVHHISSEDSSLVSQSWVRQREKEWGIRSPLYVARVQGDFPVDEEGVLLPLTDLEAAVGRVVPSIQRSGPQGLSFGVDPARFGPDKTALAVWEGGALLEIMTRQGLDTMETASWVASYVNRFKPIRVAIDSIGIGSGVTDRMKQLGHSVIDVNVSRAAHNPKLFFNLRSELAWKFREALQRGEIALPDDDQLLAELSALEYGYSPAGQIKLPPKDEVKKRLGRSPDRADAAILGWPGGIPEPPPILIGRAGPPSPRVGPLNNVGLPAFRPDGTFIR